MSIEPEDARTQDSSDADEENPYLNLVATERDITQVEIDVKEDPFQVSAIVQKIDRGQFLLNPDFQRNEVWDMTRRSTFIESILLNYPLPPLYLNQNREGHYLVVDGLQRSSSVYRFVKNEFKLSGLERLTWLNGLDFKGLDPALQSRIEDRKLLCYVLKPSVPLGVVYDIFARINRGGIQLNRQEIRHGLFQGRSTRLLKRLAAKSEFKDWIGCRLDPKRMGDEEAALRCVAFFLLDPENDYRGDMDKFLESAMVKMNKASDADDAAIEQTFEHVFVLARTILGENAFRIPTVKTKGRINIAFMESVYRFFAEQPSDRLLESADRLKSSYQDLLSLPEFLNAVRSSTGDTGRVKTRFRVARELLEHGHVD